VERHDPGDSAQPGLGEWHARQKRGAKGMGGEDNAQRGRLAESVDESIGRDARAREAVQHAEEVRPHERIAEGTLDERFQDLRRRACEEDTRGPYMAAIRTSDGGFQSSTREHGEA